MNLNFIAIAEQLEQIAADEAENWREKANQAGELLSGFRQGMMATILLAVIGKLTLDELPAEQFPAELNGWLLKTAADFRAQDSSLKSLFNQV